MHVCCKYYSDLTLRVQVRSKDMVEVLQFKATVWPKIASELTYEAQIFWGSISQTPLVSSAFCTASGLIKAGWGLGTRLKQCAHAVPWHWLRSGYTTGEPHAYTKMCK